MKKLPKILEERSKWFRQNTKSKWRREKVTEGRKWNKRTVKGVNKELLFFTRKQKVSSEFFNLILREIEEREFLDEEQEQLHTFFSLRDYLKEKYPQEPELTSDRLQFYLEYGYLPYSLDRRRIERFMTYKNTRIVKLFPVNVKSIVKQPTVVRPVISLDKLVESEDK